MSVEEQNNFTQGLTTIISRGLSMIYYTSQSVQTVAIRGATKQQQQRGKNNRAEAKKAQNHTCMSDNERMSQFYINFIGRPNERANVKTMQCIVEFQLHLHS